MIWTLGVAQLSNLEHVAIVGLIGRYQSWHGSALSLEGPDLHGTAFFSSQFNVDGDFMTAVFGALVSNNVALKKLSMQSDTLVVGFFSMNFKHRANPIGCHLHAVFASLTLSSFTMLTFARHGLTSKCSI